MKIKQWKFKYHKNKKFLIITSATIVLLVSSVVAVSTSRGNEHKLTENTPPKSDKLVDETTSINDKDFPEGPIIQPQDEDELHSDNENVEKTLPTKKPKSEVKGEDGSTSNRSPNKVDIEVESDPDTNKKPLANGTIKKEPVKVKNPAGCGSTTKPKDKTDPKKDPQVGKDSGPSVEEPKHEEPVKQPKPEQEPGNPPSPEEQIEPVYLSAKDAHHVLSKSGVFERMGDEYILEDDWGVAINVKVNKNHIGFIYFDGATYYAAKEVTYDEVMELVEQDEELAGIEWQKIQELISIHEVAVRTAAESLYGIGTKESESLCDEILEKGKTIEGYFKEF